MTKYPHKKLHKPELQLQENHAYYGKIVNWNDERGFGFIQIDPLYQNIFFHISAFAYHHKRPIKGLEVVFFVEPSPKGGWQGKRILLLEHQDAICEEGIYDIAENSKPKKIEGYLYAALDTLYFLILTYLSLPIAISSAVLSVLTVFLYTYDKSAAEKGDRRVPDASFHIASLLGGWPGALLARPMLRHKIRQNRFKFFFWASIIVNFFTLYSIVLWLPKDSALLAF